MVLAITTAQQALDARRTRTRSVVFAGGVSLDSAIRWSAQHGTDMDVATAAVTLPLPRPSWVEANAELVIEGGHNDFIGDFFAGRIVSWRNSMQRRGDTLTIRALGWTSLLSYRERFDLSYDGPISPAALFDSLCARRGVPSYRADDVTDPTGTIFILVGGNPNIKGGKVIIPASTSPLAFLRSVVEWAGYRIYDTPDGTVRLSRVSGAPVGTPEAAFVEGLHLFGASSDYDITDLVNYPDIIGQTYEDELGASIPIRAFPTPIPANPLIPVNGGINYEPIRNNLLDTQQNAEIALAVAQIDGNAPREPVRWEAIGTPGIAPGDVIEVDSVTVEAQRRYWLVGMDVTGEGPSLTATYDGWIGGGEALPAGKNLTVTRIQTAPFHIGDEVLSHYAVPAPSGTRKSWPIEIPERATAVNVVFWHHGTNSQVLSGVETELEVTRWAVYLPGKDPDDDDIRPQASGKIASLPEELSLHREYAEFDVDDDGETVTNPGFWKRGTVNLRSLDLGSYVLWILAGEKAGIDDMEGRLVDLHVYGVAEPVIVPGEGV